MSWLDSALAITKQFEGCELEAYPDVVRGWDLPTIGYGATGPDIVKGTVWTQAQADADLVARLTAIGVRIDQLVTRPITANMKAALACFSYNEGVYALTKSTLLRFLNAGFTTDAANQFLKWTISDGKVVIGLVNRRKAEKKLFLTPDFP